MAHGVDARGIGQAPKRDSNFAMSLYFVGFVIVGGFLIMNLFVGVVIESFTSTQQSNDGTAFLTPEQKEWLDIQKLLMSVEPALVYESPNAAVERGRVTGVRMSIRMMFFRIVTTAPHDS